MSGRVLYQLMRADFLERVRRYSFFVTLLASLYFGYLACTGRLHLISRGYTGEPNSAWAGLLMSIVAAVFLSLGGFYVVRQTVERDRMTRVGPIVATTPISRFEYLLGKWMSNLAVLAAMLGVLALSGVALQLVAGNFHVEVAPLLLPFVLIALPAMAMTAAVALFFDVAPVLRGGAGNIIYFFAWSFGAAAWTALWKQVPAIARLDPFAMFIVQSEIATQLTRLGADTSHIDFALNIGPAGRSGLKTFVFTGVHWDAAMIASRLIWFVVAMAVLAIAATIFDRFDPAHERPRTATKQKTVENEVHASTFSPVVALRRLTAADRGSSFTSLVVAELRLALKGQRWWWFAGAAGAVVAPLLGANPAGVVIAASLWPVLILSQFGSREAKFETASLVFNSPMRGAVHVLAGWSAGALICAALFSGALVRMALSHDAHLVGVVAAICFMPGLAIACGTASGGSRLFEAVYVALWYVGPANHTPGVDFSGATDGAQPIRFAIWAAVLLASAVIARDVRQRRWA